VLSVVMQGVIMHGVVMHGVVMLNVVILGVIMLSRQNTQSSIIVSVPDLNSVNELLLFEREKPPGGKV
jgi:hypothetical protein